MTCARKSSSLQSESSIHGWWVVLIGAAMPDSLAVTVAAFNTKKPSKTPQHFGDWKKN
jgi:hypothetical protein